MCAPVAANVAVLRLLPAMQTPVPHVVLVPSAHAKAVASRLDALDVHASAYDASTGMLFANLPRDLAAAVREIPGVAGVLEDTEPATEEIAAVRDIWT